MKLKDLIVKILVYPSIILVAIISYIKQIRYYMNDVRSKDSNCKLNNYQVFTKASDLISENNIDSELYTHLIWESMGVFRYILSALFWIAIYQLIF